MTSSKVRHPAVESVERYRGALLLSDQIDALVLAFELLIRTDALVLAAAVLLHECRDDKVRRLLALRDHALGDWHALLQASAARLPRHVCGAMQGWVRQMERPCPSKRDDRCRNSPFQTLLAMRNWRAHNEGRTDPAQVAAWLPVGDCCLVRLLTDHPPLEDFDIRPDGSAHVRSGECEVACAPLILAGSLAHEEDQLLLLRGISGADAEYATARGTEYTVAGGAAGLGRAIARLSDPLEPLGSQASPHSLRERLAWYTRSGVGRLVQAKAYWPDVMVSQIGPEAAFEAFVHGQARLLLVDGPAGAGKTSWLCSIAEGRLIAGAAVLMTASSQLAGTSFPQNFGRALNVDGNIEHALERLGVVSADGSVLILIDDLSEGGREDELLLSLLEWCERLPPHSIMKVVASIRSDRVTDFFDRHPGAARAEVLRLLHLPPLATHQLLELAERLPVREGLQPADVVATRRSMAVALGELRDSTSRRPGLAVILLQDPGEDGRRVAFAEYPVFTRILTRVVMEAEPGQRARAPLRGTILRTLGRLLFERAARVVSLGDPGLAGLELVSRRTGERSADYQYLLSTDILAESQDGLDTMVGFANPRFAEFVAALDVSLDEGTGQVLRAFSERARSYPPAMAVLAFVLARLARAREDPLLDRALHELGANRPRAIEELSARDGGSLLYSLPFIAGSSPGEVCDLARRLMERGDHQTASQAAEYLASAGPGREDLERARLLCARAHFELDEYGEAEADLDRMGDRTQRDGEMLRGDIAVARGNWSSARAAYERALGHGEAPPLTVAHALRGLGYTLAQIGEAQQAEDLFRRAAGLAEPEGASRVLAETLSDHGQLCLLTGRRHEARALLERSLAVNRQMVSAAGIGITEGLLGDIDLEDGRLEQALVRLDSAFQIAISTGNRWRQAWTAKRLARAYREQGDEDRAMQFEREASEIAEAIDARLD